MKNLDGSQCMAFPENDVFIIDLCLKKNSDEPIDGLLIVAAYSTENEMLDCGIRILDDAEDEYSLKLEYDDATNTISIIVLDNKLAPIVDKILFYNN